MISRAARHERLSEMKSVPAFAYFAKTRSVCAVSPSASNVIGLPSSLKVSTSAPSVASPPSSWVARTTTLLPSADEVVPGGAEVLAHEVPPQLAYGLLAGVGPGQRLVAALCPRDGVVDVSHGALGVFVAECLVGVLAFCCALIRRLSLRLVAQD
jgi:hypothetical protein